jgi:hypothetical protein
MDEAALKSLLADRTFVPPDAFAFVDQYLDALGSHDPELRDGLFYEAVDTWIGQGRLAVGQLSALAARLLSDGFLFKGIGEPAGPDVFRRTFSLLILASILQRLQAEPACPWVPAIAGAMARYVPGEQDLRGYVSPQGWAHAPAHAADVLAALAASRHLEDAWTDRLLALTRTLLLKSREVYTHQEDRRLARVVSTLCAHRSVDPLPWLQALAEACPPSFSDMAGYARRTNLLDFLRALYFQLRLVPGREALTAEVELQVRVLMRLS